MYVYYAEMNAKVSYVLRLVVNEYIFDVSLDSEYSVCLRSIQPCFKVFHFNRRTVNSNEFPSFEKRKKYNKSLQTCI